MKKFLAVSFFILLFILTFTVHFVQKVSAISYPDYEYTHITNLDDSSSNSNITASAIDTNGNLYLAGSFEGTVNFNTIGGTDEKTALGGSDTFLTKINADGTYAYTYIFGGIDYEWANDVALDEDGNIYITGGFWATVDFDPSDSATDNHSVVGFSDAFYTKINADGSYGYTYTWGGSTTNGFGIRVDSSENIYIVGTFDDDTDFDPTGGTDTHSTSGSNDIFLTKINADRTYGYTYTLGGVNEDQPTSLELDSNSNVYYSGYYRDNTVDLDPTSGTDIHASAPDSNGFITKINSNGSYGYSYVLDADVWNKVFYVLPDKAGNVYFAGEYLYTMDFDQSSGVDEHTSIGGTDAFLTKLNSDGSYAYTYTWGGAETDYSISLGVDQANNIYVEGITQSSSLDLDPTSKTDIKTQPQSGQNGMFLIRINANRKYEYSALFAGPNALQNYSVGNGDVGTQHTLRIDQSNNMYLVGNVTGLVNFNPFGSDIITLDFPSVRHAFVIKFSMPEEGNDDEENESKLEIKKCEHTRPPQTSRIILKPQILNGVKGLMVNWIQYDANLVVIKIDDGTGNFPWQTDKLINDGHEFLPNVASSQKIMIKPYNNCKSGELSAPVSYLSHRLGWFRY